MADRTFNLNITRIDELPTPLEMKRQLPLTDQACKTVIESRKITEDIIHGNDKRLLAIVGPCSIHDTDAALDYAKKLNELRKEVEDEILIVMRVYFEKPRTTIGWKGLINDPHLDGTYDVVTGLKRARKLMLDILDLGMPCATEMLDPVTPQYTSDLITWAAIGARTTESQTHREMTSGLSMPVGFKNGTNGDLTVATNAIQSCLHSQSFLGINQSGGKVSVFHTNGNKNAHIVLRGGSNGPNYSGVHIKDTEAQLSEVGIETGIMVDCSHANSSKDHNKQPIVLEEITSQKLNGNKSIIGFMIESNIHAGNQPIPKNLADLKYGVSITDKCIDIETTEVIIREAASKLRAHKQATEAVTA